MWSNSLSFYLRAPRKRSREERQLIEDKCSSDGSFSRDVPVTIEKESRFSADWWFQDKIFQLERRAIFSKVPSNNSSFGI
jgi:hypothetical protein